MDSNVIAIAAGIVVTLSAVSAWGALSLVKRMKSGAEALEENIKSVKQLGKKRKAIILDEALRAAQEQIELENRKRNEVIESSLLQLKEAESEMDEKQSKLDLKLNALDKFEQENAELAASISSVVEKQLELVSEVEQLKVPFIEKLSKHLGVNHAQIHQELSEEILSTEKLGISKWVLENQEKLKHESSQFAKNVLNSVYHRYSPTFVWPKNSFSVECGKREILDRYFQDESEVVKLLLQDTESQIEVQVEENSPANIKISGGAGVDKEAIRLALEEMIQRNWFSIDRVRPVILKHKRALQKQVQSMGEEALRILNLPPVHPEIAKLIGSLNFRTSHRQNQYFHSLEVARLAGMLADELGVDSSLAKRSGILHDIGKVLDYKIEGSHAVISGDYAKRFDEAENVVDTVLAHHDDKVVETPWAYILKAADAMSGARPGARVDMEDGYQKRIDGIVEVVKSFNPTGVTGSAVMHAGREVHVFVDSRRVKQHMLEPLANDICKKLESDVQFPGQIKVTLVRRLEVSEVA